jgi:hypothetical protein
MLFHQFQCVPNIILYRAANRVLGHALPDPDIPTSHNMQTKVAIGYHPDQPRSTPILDDRQNSNTSLQHDGGGGRG